MEPLSPEVSFAIGTTFGAVTMFMIMILVGEDDDDGSSV